MVADETLLQRIDKVNWLVFATMAGAGLAIGGPRFGLGVIAGGLLALGNFFLMKRHLRRTLDPRRGGGGRFLYLLKYYLRLAAIGVAVAGLLLSGHIGPFGLLLGLSVIVIAIVLVGANEARKLMIKGAR